MSAIAVLTTVGSRGDAEALARALVERRLVACAQISAIDSIYRWQGEVQHEPEFRLLLKTTPERQAALETAIRELHPYALPAIVAIAFDAVNPPFEDWIEQSVSPG